MATYAVKETFRTLQGEGRHAGRAAVFLRFSRCNLWSGREADRATAICRFCDTEFVGTDGEGGGVFRGADTLADHVASIWGSESEHRFVVCTGGEPALQMDDELIDTHGEIGKLMPYLHLPVQSGNDRVLKAMNRSHTAESYLRLLERFRAARPDLALSGDFIVGFPGETDAEFEDTLKIVDQVRYAQAYSFKYSPRPGTPAATMENQVEPDVMDERLQRLQTALRRDQQAFNEASIGKTCDVLVERRGKLDGQWLGKSPWLQSVHFTGDAEIGDLIEVKLIQAGQNSLAGEITA